MRSHPNLRWATNHSCLRTTQGRASRDGRGSRIGSENSLANIRGELSCLSFSRIPRSRAIRRQARTSNLLNDLVSQTSERDAGGASGGTSGRQLDRFVVTFDRPVDPSGPEFDAQGRLLIGTDGGRWSGGDDDLLIGGRTAFDFRGGITVAGDMEASRIAAGTPLASVTDLIIDPFNPHSSAVHDIAIARQSDGGDNWEMVVKVLDAEAGSPGDGSVRAIPPAVQQSEYESGLVWSGESGGMNGDPDGAVMPWDNVKNAKPSAGASGGDESASQTTGTVGGGHFTQIMWADTHSSIGHVNPPSWGLDRIDQRAADAATGKVSVHDISISKQCDDAGGVNALLGDGSVRHVNDAAAPFFAYGDDFSVFVAASEALPGGRLYLATEVGVFAQGVIAGGGSWGLDRIDQRDLPGGQGSVFDTSYDLLV